MDCCHTRIQIDRELLVGGWVIWDKIRLNLLESLGIAVREHDKGFDPFSPFSNLEKGQIKK